MTSWNIEPTLQQMMEPDTDSGEENRHGELHMKTNGIGSLGL